MTKTARHPAARSAVPSATGYFARIPTVASGINRVPRAANAALDRTLSVYLAVLLAVLLTVCLPAIARAAESMYVTDQFEVMMRSGMSTENRIVRRLKSGDRLTVLEQDPVSQYSLVQTSDDLQGYVLSRQLMPQPPARQRLAELESRYQAQTETVQTQTAQIDELSTELAREKSDNEALKVTLRASEQELATVRSAAENTLNIVEQNKRLQATLDDLRKEKNALQETNASLSDTSQRDWFVRGAAVFLVAFLIGILITRIRWRKQDSWGSY